MGAKTISKHNHLAEQLRESLHKHRAGATREAEIGYRDILRRAPGNVDALHLYAMLLHEQGQDEAALPMINAAIASQPKAADLYNGRCVILLGMARLEEAAQAANQAITLNPNLPEPHRNLATLCERRGDACGAIEHLRQVLEIDPHREDAIKDLSQLCKRSGRTDLIVAACVSVLQRVPSSVAAHLTLGLIFSSRILPEHLQRVQLSERKRLTERALYHLSKAATLCPCAETFDAWGAALRNANQHAKSLEKLTQAIGLNAGFSSSYENRGMALLELGRIADATEDFRCAVSLNPLSPHAQLELSRIGDAADCQSSMQILERLLDNPDISRAKRILLHFALANWYEKQQTHDSAFRHYDQANSLKAKLDLDLTEQESAPWTKKTGDYISSFSSGFFSGRNGGCSSELPIFIVSMPRSGSTLTEQIIANHALVGAGGELFEISDIAHTLSRRLSTQVPYPQCIDGLSAQAATEIGDEYISYVSGKFAAPECVPGDGSILRITDKMPTNFWHLGLIASILPNARIVHVKRHPLDVCISCFKQNLAWPYCNFEAIIDYFSNYSRMMDHWKNTLPIEIHTIRYEDLVAETERECHRIIEFCGLPWDDACLQYVSASHAVQSPSKLQVRQPIYQSSVGGWRHYEKHLQSVVEKLQERQLIDHEYAY